MTEHEKERLAKEQADKQRREQQTAEDRQAEERRQAEEQARVERTAQEERKRADERRHEEQRRQEDSRRQDEERRRSEQQAQDERRRQESRYREQEAQIHESTANTLYKKTEDNPQARYAREKGVAYVSTSGVVNDYYRHANDMNKAQHDSQGKQLTEADFIALREKHTRSSAMEKFTAQEKALGDKIQERFDAQSQTITPGKSR